MTRPRTAPVTRKLACVGKYRLTGKLLGKGNFARVEEAVHVVLQTKVAIKIMDTARIKEEYVVRNLEREAHLMAKLSHPSITALYETLQCGTVYYLVSELAPGGDLCSYIKTHKAGRLDEKTTRGYGRQLTSAIAHMHSLHIVHRDLKMENIMLTEDKQQIKIVDFGLSNTWSPESPLRTHCGSPEYAAPELFMVGYQYGPEVDLWSLGVILYGMVIGRLPFVSSRDDVMTSQERRQRLLAQINRGLTSIHKKFLSVFSGDFRNLITHLLIPTPSKRITTKNLVFHPWITHQQRQLVRISPMGKLDSYWQSIIFKELENILDIDERALSFEIAAHPYGGISGMYNIRVHQHLLQELDGDGVTYTPKTMTPTSHNAIKCLMRAQTAKTRSSDVSEDSSQHRLQTPYSAREASYRRAIKDLENEFFQKSSERNRYRNSCSRTFTNSNFQQNEKQQRNIRKAEGDSAIEDFYRPCPLHKRYSIRQQSTTSPPTQDQQLRVIGSKGVARPFNLRPATNQSEQRSRNLVASRPSTAVYRSQVKSDPTCVQSTPQPTPYTGPVHAAKRAQRRLSGLTVGNSKSVPSTPLNSENKQDISKKERDRSKERKRIRERGASGDKESSCTTTFSHGQKPDSELKKVNPIARSIADYVKNIKKDSSSPINKLKKIIDHNKLSPPSRDPPKKDRVVKNHIFI